MYYFAGSLSGSLEGCLTTITILLSSMQGWLGMAFRCWEFSGWITAWEYYAVSLHGSHHCSARWFFTFPTWEYAGHDISPFRFTIPGTKFLGHRVLMLIVSSTHFKTSNQAFGLSSWAAVLEECNIWTLILYFIDQIISPACISFDDGCCRKRETKHGDTPLVVNTNWWMVMWERGGPAHVGKWVDNSTWGTIRDLLLHYCNVSQLYI